MPVDQGAADWCEYHPPSGNSETHTKLGADARPFAFSLRENSVTRYAFLTISGHISLVTLRRRPCERKRCALSTSAHKGTAAWGVPLPLPSSLPVECTR